MTFPRTPRPVRIPVWAWVGVAAALLFFSLFSIRETRRLQRELSALQEQIRAERSQTQGLESDRQLYECTLAILAAQDTREIELRSAGSTVLPDVRAYWNAQLGLVVAGQQVPSPAADRTFQLWVIPRKGSTVSAGIFRPDATGNVLHITKPETALSAATALAITDEPAGGRAHPTTKPLWVGPVS